CVAPRQLVLPCLPTRRSADLWMAASALSRAPWPLATMTLMSDFNAMIWSSSANPSLVPSGSGGRPRSSVTTAGSSARKTARALERSPAKTTSKSSYAHLSCAWRPARSEEHTSELQSRENLVCRLLLEKKKKKDTEHIREYNS